MMIHSTSTTLFHFVVVFVSVPRAVRAGANANCLSAPTWIGKTYKLTYGTYSDLNQCQLDALEAQGVNFKPNNNLIGGDGDASLFEDIYLGGKSDGCQSTENCMKDCQALCCIVPSCMYAVIHRDEDTYCPTPGTCEIYKEDAYYWSCILYSAGTWKNTDDDTTCYVESQASKSSTCASVTQSGLGFNASTYQSLLYLGTNCTPTRRRHGRNLVKGSTHRNEAVVDTSSSSRSLTGTNNEITRTVQKGLQKIRATVLPGIQAAIAEDGGLKGFGEHLGRIAKSISKGSTGKMGMMRK